MKNLIYLGVAVLILFGAVIFAAIITSLPDVLRFAEAAANRPDSVTDIVMRSRTTASAPPPGRSTGVWMWVGLLSLSILFILACLAYMHLGSENMRQRRLLNRSGSGGARRWFGGQQSSAPHIAQPNYAQLTDTTTTVPRSRSVVSYSEPADQVGGYSDYEGF